SSLLSDLFAQPESIGAAGFALGGIFLMVSMLIVVYMLTFSAMMVGSTDAIYGHPVNMVRAWWFPLRLPVLATLVLVAAAHVISLMMCLLPALYVAPVLTFVLPVMIVEGRFGFDAIRRSVELAHFNPTGRWIDSVFLRLLAFLFVAMVINYALTFTVQLPFVVVQQIIFFRDAAAGTVMDPAQMMAGTVWLQVPAQILTALATAAIWLYWTFGVAMLYREVRRGKEAEDLQRAIDELTGEAAVAEGGYEVV
ncbi:MAG: hypothetical protein V3T72_04175, partial [Thermoanaerobaculia bacterium]